MKTKIDVIEIQMVIVSMVEFLNLSKPMSPGQITETAIILTREFPDMIMDDIKEVSREVKTGEYDIYGTLNGRMICKWVGVKVKARRQALNRRNLKFKQSDLVPSNVYVSLFVQLAKKERPEIIDILTKFSKKKGDSKNPNNDDYGGSESDPKDELDSVK
jgi:hypothetical protein